MKELIDHFGMAMIYGVIGVYLCGMFAVFIGLISG